MYKYDFQLSGGDKNIGTVYLPEKNSKNVPVMICCHGWGGNRSLWSPVNILCEKIVGKNIAFVTFDFFGCGETGGDYSLMTYKRWKNNLADIITWCAAQAFADPGNIGCYSFRSGSTAALRLATEDDRLAYIISVGTCISTHIGMSRGGPAKVFAENFESLRSGETKKILNVDFGIDFYLDTIINAPIYRLSDIKCPVLFLQGLQDNPYRCADAKMAYQIMKNANLPVTYIEIENGNHQLDNTADEAIKYIFDWLKNLSVISI